MRYSKTLDAARAWIDADAPILWLLGKTQSGKTSIVAEITGQAHDEIGRGFIPMTQESRLYAFPPEPQRPVLRVLDTRGLADRADSTAAADVAAAREQAHLLLVVVRVDDLDVAETLDVVAEARRRRPHLPVIVAQTGLHRAYGPHDRHVEPYPFDGSDADHHRPGVPPALGDLLLAQRRLFHDLRGAPPLYVPLDFTRPEQGIAPADYGAGRLWDVLDLTLPDVAERLRGDPAAAEAIRTKVILPWAMAAALANAPPLPVVGGLASAGMQVTMVVNIARRFGFTDDMRALWGELVSALGAGFLAGFAGSWTAQQVLKLGLGWGSAIVGSWTFAVTWAIGEVALIYFREKAAGHRLERAELRARYRRALKEARGTYQQARGAHDRLDGQPPRPEAGP